MLRPIFIVGPTASGKSALAAHLAKQLGGVVINADAYQVYRGIETISAAPGPEELALAPHHLFSHIPPSEEYDAQRHLDAARPLIDSHLAAGTPVVITGGSGLYVKFLSHGPDPLPPGDPKLREELDALPLDILVARLTALDPVGAAATNLKNRRYVTRNLEICLLAGEPMSELKAKWENAPPPEVDGFVLQWDRETLASRIERRTRLMLEQGAIQEVAKLFPPHTAHRQPPTAHPSVTCAKAIGIREIRRHLSGEITRDECAELITIATRQYAKRQRTWFRRESNWLTPLSVDESTSAIKLAEQLASRVAPGT